MARLADKVAIITGAASGMGLAGAQLFAAEGAIVVMTDIAETALQKQAAALQAAGRTVIALPLDVASPAGWNDVVEETIEKFGRVEVLVNNAGMFLPGGILDVELDAWNRVLAVNTTGVWLGMKSAIPYMQRQGQGSIINVSSVAALVGGTADNGFAAYSASKGAVRSLSRHASQWFAKDSIRVNSIYPGLVYTGIVSGIGWSREQAAASPSASQVPLPPHIGDPEDIGHAMVYLASDESKYVTGAELVIDGGWTAH